MYHHHQSSSSHFNKWILLLNVNGSHVLKFTFKQEIWLSVVKIKQLTMCDATAGSPVGWGASGPQPTSTTTTTAAAAVLAPREQCSRGAGVGNPWLQQCPVCKLHYLFVPSRRLGRRRVVDQNFQAMSLQRISLLFRPSRPKHGYIIIIIIIITLKNHCRTGKKGTNFFKQFCRKECRNKAISATHPWCNGVIFIGAN